MDLTALAPDAVTGAAAVLAALVTAGPAYLAARRSTRAAASAETAAVGQGYETREAVAALAARLDSDREARDRERAETREDIRALRDDVRAVREWQAGHDAEHIVMRGE